MFSAFHRFLFWQPSTDFFGWLSSRPFGSKVIVVSNYLIWLYLFYLSSLLIKVDLNIFWQLLVASILSEVIEKYLKTQKFWLRPLVSLHHRLPSGLLTKWYRVGSFPSGHAVKAVFFLLFILQYQLNYPLPVYLSVTGFLVLLRIPLGFHYPIDFIGGVFFGFICWLLASQVTAPSALNAIIGPIFYYVFGS